VDVDRHQIYHRQARYRAFSIIELMVTIGIVAVLIGLLLPALSGASIRAKEIAALNDLRQIGVSIQLYTESEGGVYPYHTPGEWYLIGPPDQPQGLIYDSNDPWSMAYLWPTLMHRVAPWREHYTNWVGQGRDHGTPAWESDRGGRWVHPAYRMSNSFIATPATWGGPGTPRVSPVSTGRVRFPSAKVLHFDAMRPYLPEHRRDEHARALLFADGSARTEHDEDAREPVQNLLADNSPELYHDTPEGVEGRDFE